LKSYPIFNKHTSTLSILEKEIGTMVYQLSGLSEEEIAIVEKAKT